MANHSTGSPVKISLVKAMAAAKIQPESKFVLFKHGPVNEYFPCTCICFPAINLKLTWRYEWWWQSNNCIETIPPFNGCGNLQNLKEGIVTWRENRIWYQSEVSREYSGGKLSRLWCQIYDFSRDFTKITLWIMRKEESENGATTLPLRGDLQTLQDLIAINCVTSRKV